MRPFDNCMSPMEKEWRQNQAFLKEMRENDDFKKCITNIVEKYIKMIDTKISMQDKEINKAVSYMTDKIIETSRDIIVQALNDGKLDVTVQYDPESESLLLVASGGVG